MSYPQSTAALTDATRCAAQVLRTESSPTYVVSSPTVIHNHYHDDWGWNPFWRPFGGWGGGWGCHSNHYHTHYPSYSSSRRDREDYTGIAIVAALIALPTAYFLGQNFSEWSNADQALYRMRNTQVNVVEELTGQPALRAKMKDVFDNQDRVLVHQKGKAETGLALKTGLAASAVFAFVGAIAAAPAIVTVGVTGALLSGSAMLVLAGYKSFDHSLEYEAQALQRAAETAGKALV